jgi:6-phosphogluconolactonase
VTEKATSMIVKYRVGFFGYAGGPNAQPSAGETPFGFAFDRRGRLIVSEAFGGAPDASVLSSYALASDGTITPITPKRGDDRDGGVLGDRDEGRPLHVHDEHR